MLITKFVQQAHKGQVFGAQNLPGVEFGNNTQGARPQPRDRAGPAVRAGSAGHAKVAEFNLSGFSGAKYAALVELAERSAQLARPAERR